MDAFHSRSTLRAKALAALWITTLTISLTAGFGSIAHADQAIDLRAGWNLVAFSVLPEDDSAQAVLGPLLQSGRLESVWTYDATTKRWLSFPVAPAIGSTITQIQIGRGYWIRLSSGAPTQLVVLEPPVPPRTVPRTLKPGWNLIGLDLDGPAAFSKVFRSGALSQLLPITEIWRFDADAGAFRGITLAGGVPTTTPAFTEIEEGRGYWVFLGGSQEMSMPPLLATAMRGDEDVPPLLPPGLPRQRTPFSVVSPGDADVGLDGFYDRPETQRAISFVDNTDIRSINISNFGLGVLRWRVAIENPQQSSWIRIRELDPRTGQASYAVSRTGAATSESDLVQLEVDRTGLGPGEYAAVIVVESSAPTGAFPEEPARRIPVRMSVFDIEGDYQVRAEIETVNGKPADLPNPRLALSLYRDGSVADPADDNRLKGAINPADTLLFPAKMRLTGGIYEANTARFILSGSTMAPKGSPGNPFRADIRRDLTLVGDRRQRGNPQDALLGPLDLRGRYFETIRNALGQPIQLVGSFTALRKADVPSALDPITRRLPIPVGIPAQGAIPPSELEVTQNLLLADVDILVDITHSRPSDLVVDITSPLGETVVLRANRSGPTGSVIYDETAVPEDPLSVYRGTMSRTASSGKWRLRVADSVAGEQGTLNTWELRLLGTRVGSISGTIAGIQGGADVLLSGCGVTQTTKTKLGGAYLFSDLVDCVYQVTLQEPGFQRSTVEVALDATDRSDVNLSTQAIPPLHPRDTSPPKDDRYRFASITTQAGAGSLRPGPPEYRLQYVTDTGTFDLDRPPKGGGIGDEDTSEFSGSEGPVTRSNIPNFEDPNDPSSPLLRDSSIDGAVGVNSKRAYLSLGGGIIGSSVEGANRLSIGNNP